MMPRLVMQPGLLQELNQELGNTPPQEGIEQHSAEERQQLLAEKLDLSGLDRWPEHLASKARALIMAFHNIFSLNPCELGCTSGVEHDIKVTDEVPFKERFRQIPPDMVDEVHEHIHNMLEAGAIRPSNNPWCNAVVLVWQ